MVIAIECVDLTKRYHGAPPMRGPGGPGGRGPTGGPPANSAGRPTPVPSNGNGILAVDCLNLTIESGEFFGLLGPNGAGKSTTIGMLTTRVRPTSGEAHVAGVDVVANPSAARKRLAAVTQVNTLDRSLSVFDNLYFHGRYFGLSRGECRRRAMDLLERFQLVDRAKASVDTLSGGLAQRVQVARALLHQPDVLFLDEPTAGLDPQSRFQLWQVLQELNRGGQTIVLTTHYMEEAEKLCRRLAIVDHGKLLALDTPDGLKSRVHADRFVTVTLPEPDDGTVVAALGEINGVHRVEAAGAVLRVYAASTPGLTGTIVNAIVRIDREIQDLSVSEPSLETVFLDLTGTEYRE